MFIATITRIGFVENDDQTIGFRKYCNMNLGMNEDDGFGKKYCKTLQGSFKMVAKESLEECLEHMQKTIRKYILRGDSISKADLSNFYFTVAYQETNSDGEFWNPSGNDLKRYRLSDLEVI